MTRRHMLGMLAGAAVAAPAVTELRVMGDGAQSLSNLRTIKSTLSRCEDFSTYAVIMHPYVLRDIERQMRGPKKLRGGPKK